MGHWPVLESHDALGLKGFVVSSMTTDRLGCVGAESDRARAHPSRATRWKSLITLICILVSAIAVEPLPMARPLAATGLHDEFEEIAGVRQLSTQLIVRPRTRRALRAAGFTAEEINARVSGARRELARYQVLRHVRATDDSILQVPSGLTEREVARALMATGLFEYAEPNWILSPLGVQTQAPGTSQTVPQEKLPRSAAGTGVFTRPLPAPPRFPPTQNLPLVEPFMILPGSPRCPDDPLFASQWHHQTPALDSCAAWGTQISAGGTTGSPRISIGICDTGVLTSHEDLSLNRLEGYNAVDKLWESEGGKISPVQGHGTRTTGAAAANGNNGLGVSGVGWNLSHRMLRVSNVSSGNAFLADIQEGVRTSIENGDRVANVSYHGASSFSNGATSTYVKSLGGLMLWGAGNTSSNFSSPDRDSDDLIVVGATDQSDALASFSSYGNFIDLVAPGVGIVTTTNTSSSAYSTVEGTSYACPITSGVCGMIWDARPNLSPNDVERILKASADDIGAAGLDPFFGYGRVNLARAIRTDWSTVPVSEFAAQTPTGVSPLPVTFTDLSTGIPTSWLWDFGDGASSTAQNPTHTYPSSGSYAVSLTVSNSHGMDIVAVVDAVVVDFIPPIASFTASITGGLSPLPVSFTNTSESGVPTTWLWDFGDGNTSTLQNPTHTYLTNGFYDVSLTATNAYGMDTLTQSSLIAVDFIPPVAGFSGTPTTGASPYVVSFTDESTAGIATSWLWSFGDGSGSSLQNPAHTYTVAGIYSVRLTASNAYGSDVLTLVDYIEVTAGPTILANFVGTPTTGTAPLQVSFTDLSIGNIISWEWNFGDGGTSTLQNPTHTFTSSDSYDIALTVTNASGKDSCLELQGYVVVN